MLKSLNKRIGYQNDIKGLQFVALDILIEFDKICRKYNINYWISDGTLLGAVRHKGFIPWDDDIDVCIKKSDEKKLRDILKKEIPYYLYLEEINKNDELKKSYKLQDRYSFIDEGIKRDIQEGIWIDIFPMSDIKKNNIVDFIINILPAERNSTDKKILKKIIRRLIWKLLNCFNINSKSEIVRYFFKKFTKKRKMDSVIYMDGSTWWHTYKKEWIFPLKELEFEGYKFLAPNNSYEYLKSYYGKDFMKLPPENKRITHSVEINLFNSKKHPESLKWEDREKHYKKWLEEKENEK